MSSYPARLTFALTDDEQAAGAVIHAARDLQLPFEIDGPQHQIVVLVDSPMQAYQFGLRTVEGMRRTDAEALR